MQTAAHVALMIYLVGFFNDEKKPT